MSSGCNTLNIPAALAVQIPLPIYRDESGNAIDTTGAVLSVFRDTIPYTTSLLTTTSTTGVLSLGVLTIDGLSEMSLDDLGEMEFDVDLTAQTNYFQLNNLTFLGPDRLRYSIDSAAGDRLAEGQFIVTN